MQSRISLTQDEISTVGSDLDALKVFLLSVSSYLIKYLSTDPHFMLFLLGPWKRTKKGLRGMKFSSQSFVNYFQFFNF